ncbi:LysM peptidoglycan-binding domain-containing protein [Piscibacillus sp. B03]|uniref:LysM peptidoglycan-binding domain-containing protein n=1 Tax=Piscibacillus sp. B03 TaxID=3457430 RepID=UPI003FCE09F7
MRIHVVQKGETFNSIAQKYNLSVDELVGMNRHLDHSNELMPKMKVKVPMETNEVANPISEKLDVSNKRMALPHNPNQPKMLPRVKEDEFVISDKLITSIEDDQDNEFIQQFLPEGYTGWVTPEPSPTQMYDYHYPMQPVVPYQFEEQRQYTPNYYDPYGYTNVNPYGYTYNQYDYRAYNPCGCNGYYY